MENLKFRQDFRIRVKWLHAEDFIDQLKLYNLFKLHP